MEKVRQWLQSIEMADYFPLFEENQIFFDDLKDITSDDLKEIGINSLPHRKKLLAAIHQTGDRKLSLPLLENFDHLPYPAVMRMTRMNEAIASNASVWDAVSFYKDSVEALIKTFCVYGIGHYLSSKNRNTENDAMLLKMLSRPSTGMWVNVLQKVVVLIKAEPDPARALYELFFSEKKGKDCQGEGMIFLQKFVQFRNELHHAARLSDEEYYRQLLQQLPSFQALIDQSRFLQSFPPYKGLEEGEALLLTGEAPVPVNGDFPASLKGKLFFIDSNQRFIEVEPFFIILKMEGSGDEALYLYDSQKSYGSRKELKLLYMMNYREGHREARYEPVEVLENRFGEALLMEVFSAFKATILSIGTHVNNFSAILNKHANITGREFIREKISQFMEDQLSGYFILTGEPGIGKTAIMANLINPRERQAHYFFKSGSNYDNPDDCINGIRHFLAQKYNIAVSQGLVAPEQARLDFEDLLTQISNMQLPGQHESIILDAIDESSKTQDGKTIGEILPAILPKGIYFIISTRPLNPDMGVLKNKEGFYTYHLDPAGEDNRKDAYAFIASMLDGKIDREWQTEIADKAAWNFLIIKLMSEAIIKEDFQPEDIDQFLNTGKDLQNWYQGYCERINHRFADEPEKLDKIQSILGAVAAAGDPVSKTQICEALNMSFSWFDWAMRFIGQFMDVVNISENGIDKGGMSNETFYRFYHLSFMHFVNNHLFDHHNPYHRNWADYYADWQDKRGFEHDYAIKSYPRHLHLSGQKSRLLEIITHPLFVLESSRIGKHFELATYWQLFPAEEIWDSAENGFNVLTANPDTVIQAYLAMGEIFQHLGRYMQAIEYFGRAYTKAEELQQTGKMGEARFAMGWCLRHIDQFEEAIRELSDAIRLYETTGNIRGIARAYSVMGINQWQLHLDTDALASLEKSLQLFENTDALRLKAEAHNHMGIIYRGLGQYEPALYHLKKARELIEKNNDIKGLGKVMNSLGTATWWSGNPEASIEFYRRANEINEKIGQFYIMGITWNNLGYVYLELNNADKAIEAFQKARDIRKKINVRSFELMDISGLALSYLHAGEPGKALEYSCEATEGLKEFQTVEDLQRAWYNHYLVAREFPDRMDEAENALQKAKELVMARYERITDPTFRKSYIEAISLNKAILSVFNN